MSTKNQVDAIKVRMYRHGFGDCFLLSFMHGEDRIGLPHASWAREMESILSREEIVACL